MLSPTEFRREYPPEKLAEELPDRPVTSLRDVQYLYGRLYTLATAGGGEYADYLTPDEANGLFGEEESLIAVRVDLSGEVPRLDRDQPVLITQYKQEDVSKIAYCCYPNKGSGIDHSITHKSGQNKEPEKLAEYAQQRLYRWTEESAVRSIAEEHEDGWIIDVLAALGNEDRMRAEIECSILRQLGGKTTALLTVQIRLEDEYRYPGELESDVFNAAMKAQKFSKLVSKNEATNSTGMAVDLLTGERTRTVGTAEDPLNYYLGMQMEKFPGFDPDEGWRSHPVSQDAAVTIMNARTFIHSCTYSTFGATVYYIPYFLGRISAENAYKLYHLLYAIAESEDLTPVEEAYRILGGPNVEAHGPSLRFYVSAVMKHQASRYDVFGDTMNGSLLYPMELDWAHREVLQSWIFDVKHDREETISPPLPTYDEDWSLLHDGEYLGAISTGAYFYATFSHGDDDQDASADDARIEALVSVLSGEALSVEMLLGEYVDRLLDEEGESFPSFVVASQFAQLCALADADLLTARDAESNGAMVNAPNYENWQTMYNNDTQLRADGGTIAAARETKLERFIEETPALENDQRRGAFLLGALVGQVGGYQQGAEGRSTTVVDQYSIKSMTKARLKRITEEVLDRNVVYSRENRMRSTMYAEVVDRLVETLAKRDPETWDIKTDDLRFYYSLGVAYGLNNWTESEEETDEDRTEDTIDGSDAMEAN